MSRAAIAKDLVAAQARALKMPGLARVYEGIRCTEAVFRS
jgi:hypothetical protein